MMTREEAESTIPLMGQLDLSPEQRQVVSLIAEGMDTEDIAEAMSISQDTVKRKIRRIRSKVGGTRMTDLPELVEQAETG